jgi:hypothetical protein
MTPLSYNSIAGGVPFGNNSQRPSNPSIGQIYYNGQLAATEIYTSSGWAVMGALPESATIGTATDIGTSRAFNDAAASVTFTPSATGGLATVFTATSTPGGYTGTGSSSPVTVPGLVSGTSYTFSVVASNSYGNSLGTTQTNSITATSVPQSPSIGSATNPSGQTYASTGRASVAFTQVGTGGKSISNYKYSIDGGTTYTALSPAQTSSPLSITGLTSGSSYSFIIKAVNANGDSIASSTSNSVTISTVPQAPTITSVTSSAEGSATIAFTPGSNGNSSVTSYTVSSNTGGYSASGASSPITINGMAGGTYTFTVTATNANGTSAASTTSSSITLSVITGGTASSSGGYTYRTFTNSGTLTVAGAAKTMDILVVGGGGADSNGSSNTAGWGGGGGGGMQYATGYSVPAGSYTITVGAGGSASTGNNATPTGFGNLAFAAGGGQGNFCGPGGSASSSTYSGFTAYNNTGGSGDGSNRVGGGGGGAGGNGGAASGGNGGNGGSGRAIFNSTYAGGGGGGGNSSGGSAGSGGGGRGANGSESNGVDGTAGTGGGAGGGRSFSGSASRTNVGGSGVVVVRYT